MLCWENLKGVLKWLETSLIIVIHGRILYECVAALACESLKLRWSSKNGKIAPISKCLR